MYLGNAIDLVTGADATSPGSNTHQETTAIRLPACRGFIILAELMGGTGGALDVLIEHSPDGVDWYEAIHFTQAAAATASFQHISRQQNTAGTTLVVGKNNTTTMTLAASSVGGPPLLPFVRVRYVAGVGTSAGATQRIRFWALLD